MITTNSFPNMVTNSSNSKEDIKRNSLTKEDLEGKSEKKNNNLIFQNFQNINGGTYKLIENGK